MKITIDFETVENSSRQDWLLETLKREGIQYEELTDEREWTKEEVKEHNRLIDIALADESISMEEAKKIMDKW